MNKKYNIYIFIGAALYMIYHIATLVYSPIPWFDEVTYASITESFIKNGRFYEEARNISPATAKVDLAYGPVYFMLQAFVTKVFGFTIFTFRMTSMFFGFACLYLLYHVCRRLKFSNSVTIIAILLIAFDPQFNQFLHSGRMDYVALFLFLSGYLLFTGINNDGSYRFVPRALLAGVFISGAFLTNPRVLFSFSFFLFFFLYELIEGRFKNIVFLLVKNLAVVFVFVCLYGVWIYTQFGSLSNYIYETYTNSPIMQHHVGVSFSGMRLNYNLVMHLTSLVCALLLIASGKARQHIHVLLLTFPGVVVFLLMVTDGLIGRYYGLVVPFTTLLIVGCTIHAYNNVFTRVFSRGVLVLFLLVFVGKASYIFASMDQRDPAKYGRIISGYVPANALVAADFQYYYIGKKNSWTYQCLEENGLPEEKIAYFMSRNYEYFVINKNNGMRTMYEQSFLKDRYKLIATVEDNNYNSFFHGVIGKLPYRITEGYACYIYKLQPKP